MSLDLAVLGIDDDGITGLGFLAQEHFAQRVLDFTLDGALQRACTILDVKSAVSDQVLGGIGDFQLQAVLLDALVERGELDIDNLEDAVVVQ